jgi:putative ABC transport system ATP-binding protein
MIQLENISKIYKFDDVVTEALKDVSLIIENGEFVAIMGASGSGKSTLLNIIGCMDTATSGKYTLDNEVISELNSKELSKIRNKKVTFVFQNFALMEKYTAYENIELPLVNRKVPAGERHKRVLKVAQQLGIEGQLRKLPKQMSGGQQQRIALARALVSGADIILADEPTGALDHKTGIELMEILRNLNENGKTIILVTHDPAIAGYAKRIITISDGGICQ